ncbi:MAG: molybdenum cofactor biosynthesis protein MoaE [Gemmatimonadota bacterium]
MIRITDREIDPTTVLSEVGSLSDGAQILFLGTVRNHNEQRSVEGLRYEAYPEMALTELEAIVAEARDKFESPRIAVVHRIGRLEVGDVAVAVAVSTPHRAEAFGAARYIMEELKQRLPIWKEEAYLGGETAWVEGREPMP